jgi:opacity protein-like surface antigen
MVIKTKPAILFLTGIFILQGLCGQAPADMKDLLVKRFKGYCESVPREEIFLHSDREEYIAGEEMWLNIYLINRQSSRPSLSSSVAYVELLNSENRPVMQKRVIINKGYGPGLIDIPDTLTSGNYTLRAYTGWMKNFLPENCFTKQITVYNTLGSNPYNGQISKIGFTDPPAARRNSNRLNNPSIGVKLNNQASDILEILINADNSFRYANNDVIYLFIQTHGNINFVSSEKLVEGTTRITVPKSLLNEGINQVTVFNSNGIPVAEKYNYTPGAKNDHINIISSESYNLRSEVTIDVEEDGRALSSLNSGNFSISVAPESDIRLNPGISDYLLFGSEYGPLPWNILKGRNINDLSAIGLDSILSDITSSWIKWPEIFSGKLPQFRYPHESESQLLTGRLLNADQQPAGKDELLFLCIPGKQPGFSYAKTDAQGIFSFTVHTDEELKDLIIMPDDTSKNQKIIIESPFSTRYAYLDPAAKLFKSQIPPYIQKWSLNYQVGKIYRSSSAGTPLPTAFKPLKQIRFYGKPDLELIMADYIKLPVMEEVIFELLPQVSLRKRDGKYEIVVHDRIDDILYTSVPVLMIDGVIIKDASLIVNLDPETVERIDVINTKYLVGKYLFQSIINVITKSGDFTGVPLPDYMVRLPYRVADPVPTFVSPDYSSEEMKKTRLPDYRNTLYWNPAVKTGNDGKARISFWSSDNKSDYLITIQGIGSDGKLFSASKVIHVK